MITSFDLAALTIEFGQWMNAQIYKRELDKCCDQIRAQHRARLRAIYNARPPYNAADLEKLGLNHPANKTSCKAIARVVDSVRMNKVAIDYNCELTDQDGRPARLVSRHGVLRNFPYLVIISYPTGDVGYRFDIYGRSQHGTKQLQYATKRQAFAAGLDEDTLGLKVDSICEDRSAHIDYSKPLVDDEGHEVKLIYTKTDDCIHRFVVVTHEEKVRFYDAYGFGLGPTRPIRNAPAVPQPVDRLVPLRPLDLDQPLQTRSGYSARLLIRDEVRGGFPHVVAVTEPGNTDEVVYRIDDVGNFKGNFPGGPSRDWEIFNVA